MRARAVARTAIVLALVTSACTEQPSDVFDTLTGDSDTTTSSSLVVTSASQSNEAQPPDLIIYNGKVLTVNDEFAVVEAVAVTEGDITALGSSGDVLATAGPSSNAVDLGGRTVMPGFVDPHTHHMQVGAPDIAAMRSGQALMIEGGTTTNGEPSVAPDHLEAFQVMDAAGEMIVRTHLYLLYNDFCNNRDLGDFYLAHSFTQDPDLRLATAGVKMFADGGACRAPAFSHDYLATTPDRLKEIGWVGNGDLYATPEEVASVVSVVDTAGGVTVIHAVGDLALSAALEGLATAYAQQPFAKHQRIDHNSVTTLLAEDRLAVYSDLAMIPVIFPVPWAGGCDPDITDAWQSILPEQVVSVIEDSAALRAANPDMRISWHGDAPSVPGQPFQLMYSLVTGGAVDIDSGETCKPPAWKGFHTVDVEEAMRMMTINAAAAMGIEQRVGSLQVGKVADLLILAEDPLQPDPEIGIAANRPLVTIIDGQAVFCDGDFCELLGIQTGSDVQTIDVPEGWETVDHPYVVAIMASKSIEPASQAVDGSEDTSWVSGADAPQWIEVDLGRPVAVASIRLKVDQAPPGMTVHAITAGGHIEPGMSVFALDGETEWSDWLEARIDKTVQFIRITTTESPSWVAWVEIEIIPGD